MAAVTTTSIVPLQFGHNLIRTAAAQASTGQTDWVSFPWNATYAQVYLNITAFGGTTRIVTPSFLVPATVSPDDGLTVNLAEHAAFTGITAINQYIFDIGPGVTGIANDVTNSATADSYVSLNAILPPILGMKLLLDRGDGDETYSYTLSAWVKP